MPVVPGWTRHPCGYLLFGPPYAAAAEEARGRGWPVIELPGQHLHMVVDPAAVARALLEMARRLSAE